MADSVYPATGGFVDNTSAATFIPELWSDEVRAAFKSRLVMANNVKKINHSGKKGDTIRIPAPIRGEANAKAENTAVTVQNQTEGQVVVSIDKHYEFSRLIEDITETQALDTLRQFYTDDAGYGLAKQMDTDLMYLGTGLGNGTYAAPSAAAPDDWEHSACFFNDAGTTPTQFTEDTMLAADVWTDAFFRDRVQALDDEDVPAEGRVYIIPPVLKNTMLGVDRFNSADFTSQRGVQTGMIGEVYGIKIFVSTNCPTIETVAQNGAGSGVASRASLLFHPEAFILAEQQSIRSQVQYKQEWLGTLYTSDTLYGVKNYRTEAGQVLAVPA
jgi:N4-gp56 family major capsid protein